MCVPAAGGALRARVRYPGGPGYRQGRGPWPGIVLVHGAGDGIADGWGHWPATVAGCGAVVLSYDKPGCGGSPGDWRTQTLADRAREALAALEVLRGLPDVDAARVGLFGGGQGGWVCYLAAALAPRAVAFLAAVGGPGVRVAEQERHRISLATGGDPDALAWVDERARRLAAGDDPARVLADQRVHAGRPWYAAACEGYATADLLGFAGRVIAFDPADALARLRCPVFAAFGGADGYVPVQRSVEVLGALLPPDPRHAVAVFPGADHGLYTAPPDPTRPRATQLTPGFLPMLTAWLAGTAPD